MGGYAVWTLTEYWLHRVVFHFEPERGHRRAAALDDPRRPPRPPERPAAARDAAVGLACRSPLLFGGLFWLVLGGHWFMPFLAGFLAGYLAYDMIHYHVHHHRPRTRVGRRLRELHMRHHFQDDERGFGVSAPYWDHVFGTPPEKRAR